MAIKRRADGRLETSRKDPRTGKVVHFYGATERELNRKILEWQDMGERGRLFSEVAGEWEAIHFPTLAANTLKGYRPALRRAVETFGSIPIRQLRPADVKGYINKFARGLYAKKTVTTQLQILSMICAYAVEQGDITTSPCDHVSIPKNLPKTRREAATEAEEAIIKQTAGVWLLPYLILYTGLRRGEALALTWADIDLKRKTISVTKSVYHDGTGPHIKTPKTAAGNRTVPLLAPLERELRLRMAGKPKGYIFSNDGGKTPLTDSGYTSAARAYVKATGMTATPHQIRHSYATMLFECGVDVKDAQDLLGHTTAAMTQDIYTHIRDSRRKTTAEKLNNYLSEKLQNTGE